MQRFEEIALQHHFLDRAYRSEAPYGVRWTALNDAADRAHIELWRSDPGPDAPVVERLKFAAALIRSERDRGANDDGTEDPDSYDDLHGLVVWVHQIVTDAIAGLGGDPVPFREPHIRVLR